jgi:glycosyltransferase involved in cell wall biosynthesis
MNYPNIEHYRLFMSPIKMFEYMASNVPVVTTDLPVVREVLTDDDAWFVKPDDVEDLARGITNAIEQKAESEKKAQKAFEKVQAHYTWGKRAENILQSIV